MDKEKSKREKWIHAFGSSSGYANVCLETEIIANDAGEPDAIISAHVIGPDETFSDENKAFEATGLMSVQMLCKCSCALLNALAMKLAEKGVPTRVAKHEWVSGHEPPPPEMEVLDSSGKLGANQKVSVIITGLPRKRDNVIKVLRLVMRIAVLDAEKLLNSIPARIACPGEDAAKILLSALSKAGCGCEIKVEPEENDEELF